MNTPRRWLTVAEAAAYLGISVKGAYEMAASGKLPAARVGRLVRVDLRTLEADLESQEMKTLAAAGLIGHETR